MLSRKIVLFICMSALPASDSFAAKKKSKPEVTQVLELPKDPPLVAFGNSGRMVFHVSPLSANGLLSQQTRDALKAILKANGGANVVHLRAFVSGSGDVRRVSQIVSEVFSGRRMALPSISVIQAGALPLQSAQVVIEAISETKAGAKSKTPTAGLGFLPVKESMDALVAAAGSNKPVMVSCFVSELTNPQQMLAEMAAKFPGAAINLVQMQRYGAGNAMKCEGITRGGSPARLAFTGTRLAVGGEEDDIKQAFMRLYRDLREAGVAPEGIVSTHIYPISPAVGIMVNALLDIPGTMNLIPFEGLASLDASLAVESVAVADSGAK